MQSVLNLPKVLSKLPAESVNKPTNHTISPSKMGSPVPGSPQ
jgi:hypothetical protein